MTKDDAFMQFAQKQEEAAQRTSNYSNSKFTREYEDIKYCGLEPNKDKIIRVVGNPPNFEDGTPFDAKTVIISRVIDDNGKQMRLIRPSKDYAGLSYGPENLINRIISTVKKTRYENNEKVYVVQKEHPEVFNLIEKNGLEPTDSRYKFDRGWNGRSVVIMNVIDRSQMDWHKENKHTMLLSRNISEKNGVEYAEEGIPVYGFIDKLLPKFAAYGSWEGYDIAVRRTGQMNNPYQICVASRTPEEVQAAMRQYISSEKSLTEEEESWERYDISKLFAPTTYTKIFNRLQNKIKMIDGALNTHFYEELKELAEKEKKEREEQQAEEAAAEETVQIHEAIGASTPSQVTESRPVPAQRRPAAQGPDFSLLPHIDVLTDEQKAMIKSVKKNLDGSLDIVYNTNEIIYNCVDSCGATVPESFIYCPYCGSKQI